MKMVGEEVQEQDLKASSRSAAVGLAAGTDLAVAGGGSRSSDHLERLFLRIGC